MNCAYIYKLLGNNRSVALKVEAPTCMTSKPSESCTVIQDKNMITQ